VDGFAPITGFKDGPVPEATIDLTEIFKGKLNSAARRFVKESSRSLLIEDNFENLEILSPANLEVSIISLDPPPLKLDKRIENLKRIEIRVPAYFYDGLKGDIIVRLKGE
jgi:hypothetical protein